MADVTWLSLQQEALPIPPIRPDRARHRRDNRLSCVPTEMKRATQPKGRESRPVGPCSAYGESVPTLTGSFVVGLITTGVSLPGLKYYGSFSAAQAGSLSDLAYAAGVLIEADR